MPEGHVIHRLANAIDEAFGGETVRVASPQGRFADAAGLLDGTRLVGADAVGKHLFVEFPGERFVWVHLGLIGKMRFVPREDVLSPETLRLRIAGGDRALELRGPQWCRLVTRAEVDAVAAASGPDPLRSDADPDRAWVRVHRSGRPFAALLMDQRAFAGVGNIFRAEVLFRHGLNPLVPAKNVSRRVFDAVWDDLVELMAHAVEVGTIDTVRPGHMPEVMGRPPRIDRHGGEVYVYRRAGMPCHVCRSEVRTAEMEGRHLYWCPRCQRGKGRRLAG